MQKIRRILSIDGGGVRGIIPATVLAAVEEKTGKPISQLFDLIAGTSTGAILALGLAKPDSAGNPQYSAKRLCELYNENIPHIFNHPQSWWGNLLGPKYKSFAFQDVLKKAFGECLLSQALVDVIVPCYDIEHRRPYTFRSRLAKPNPENDFPMRDIALAASSSPTLFHPVSIQRRSSEGRIICLVDGGVFANNPSICAYSEARSLSQDENEKYVIVSLGTGTSTKALSDEYVSLWGYVQWSGPMLELVMESISESVHEQIRHLLPGDMEQKQSYYRLQVDLPRYTNFALDDAASKKVRALEQTAEEFCASSKELSRVCDHLLQLSTLSAVEQ